MLYPGDVKRELDSIVEAFDEYTRGQDYFDIVYSEKFGYLWVAAPCLEAIEAKRLKTVKEMLESFFHDVIDDVIFSSDNPTKDRMDLELTEYEERESRRWITEILETIESDNKARYLELMNAYINIRKN